MRWGAAGVLGTFLSVLPENEGAVDGRNKPEDHVDHVDPGGALHSDDPTIALGVLFDVHLAKDAKEDHVEEKGESIDTEEQPGLDERDHENQGENSTPRSTEDSVGPLWISVFSCLPSLVEILSV